MESNTEDFASRLASPAFVLTQIQQLLPNIITALLAIKQGRKCEIWWSQQSVTSLPGVARGP